MARGSNVRWRITVRPDSDSDATVVLPETTDCDAEGPSAPRRAVCCPTRWSLTVSRPQGQVMLISGQ